jgi:hypothetical protein
MLDSMIIAVLQQRSISRLPGEDSGHDIEMPF